MTSSGVLTRYRILGGAIACVAVLGISACGGDDDGGAPSSGATGPTGAEGITPEEQREQVYGIISDGLVSDQGASPSEAACVTDQLDSDFSADDVNEIVTQVNSGPLDKAYQDVVTAAAVKCGIVSAP